MASNMTSWKSVTLGLSGLILLGLSACDQRQDRIERAQALGEAVVDQLLGQPPTAQVRNIEKAPVKARALAGELLSPNEIVPVDMSERRYAIGSIVAKPRDLAPTIALAEVMAEPELVDEILVDGQAETKIVVLDRETEMAAADNPEIIERIERPATSTRQVAVIDPDARIATRSLKTDPVILPRKRLSEEITRKQMVERGLPAPPEAQAMVIMPSREEQLRALPQLEPKVAQRAMALRTDTLVKQLSAEDRMIETATKYGVAASIQRSRSGQMVIEIGSGAMKPTQFTTERVSDPTFGIERQIACTDDAVRRAHDDPALAMECVIQELQASGEFEYVEKDYLFDHQMIRTPGTPPATPVSITPNDPLFDLQWHFLSRGSGADQSEGGAGFVDFWTDEANQGSQDVVVAVVDTGLEMSHPDIAGSPNVMPGWDMVTDPTTGNDGDGRDDNPDDPGDRCPERGALTNSYHGTHVAGTIGAGVTNNSAGVAGAAWNVKIVPVRALGKCGGRLSDINDAIRWAAGTIPEYDALGNEVWNDNPADIINLSIGLFKTCPASMQDAIDAVTDAGVIVVSAAGNNRISTDFYAPAGCRNVVTVAGGDARGYLAPYSNYGEGVDILAPGGDLTRDDNGDGNPDGVLSTKTAEHCIDPVTGAQIDTCFYAYEQGTSMAAPHVSAALALVKSKRPDLTASELLSRLTGSLASISQEQCTGACSQYPGAEPTADDPSMCYRPCGAGSLDLSRISLSD